MFKKEVELTLTKYVNKQRIDISVKLLVATDMQIQDIASFVGIDDVNYFIKLFKNIIGDAPTTYKRALNTDSLISQPS